jgi:putative transposase
MPRTARIAPGGVIFHVINRGNARNDIFASEQDFAAFEAILAEALRRYRVKLLGYCLMHNHWHLLLLPQRDGELGRFMQWLTVTHVRRWHQHRGSVGSGHLYQGSYKSFPVQADEHFLIVLAYIERNALRAGLVKRAERWRWCSLWAREHRTQPANPGPDQMLSPWPVDRPRNWLGRVNRAQAPADVASVQLSIQRGRPLGTPHWQKRIASALGLTSTFRDRGRPRKKKKVGQ